VSISLKNKEAKIYYSTDLTPNQIAIYIQELGFNAYVKETDDIERSQSDLVLNKKKKKKEVEKKKVEKEMILQANGAGDIKELSKEQKCFLHVTVRYALYFYIFTNFPCNDIMLRFSIIND